jgi:hypothetical protein
MHFILALSFYMEIRKLILKTCSRNERTRSVCITLANEEHARATVIILIIKKKKKIKKNIEIYLFRRAMSDDTTDV